MPATEIGLRHRVRRLSQQIAEQHRQLDLLQREVFAALARDARADGRHALERFTSALAGHFDLEQRVFFPALHGLAPSRTQELEALEREHAGFLSELHRSLAELETVPGDAFGREFQQCLDGLRGHERREERLVGEISDES
jgi:Hemerythrin HHE cation binding domain